LAKILVLDGHNAAALAFTRSAGRAEHWVAVGANQGLFAAAKLSRYCRLSFDYPISTDDADAFVSAVLDFARQHAIDLIVPTADWTLQPLSEQRNRFEGICRIALPRARPSWPPPTSIRRLRGVVPIGNSATPPTPLPPGVGSGPPPPMSQNCSILNGAVS
jgi:hypothetical protein